MKSLVTLLLYVFVLCPVAASELLSYQLQDGALILQTDNGQVSLTAYGQESFEVFYQPTDVPQLPGYAVSDSARQGTGRLEEQGKQLVFSHGQLRAVIERSPLRFSFFRGNTLLLEEESGLFVHQTLRGFRFRLQQEETLLGAGERVLGMDRRGHRLPLYNKAHYGYGTKSSQMYYGLPMLLSSQGYMLIFDNAASGHLDLGHSETNILQFEAVAGRTAYLVVSGEDMPAVVRNTTSVTGRQPMPPRWALGNYASRFGYHTEQETRQVAEMFRRQDIPLDAVILDLYWFGKEVKGMMGNLDWDRQAFPNPEQMIADFKEQGIKTILITEPFVLTTSKKWQEALRADALSLNLAGEAKRFDFFFGNTGLIDVFHPAARDWFWQTYQNLLDQGVSGWWGDLGEPEVHPGDTLHRLADGRVVTADEIHNAYGHKWAQLVFERHRQARPDERPFIMMRSGFVGSQRFGMIPWTGDVSRSWDGLKPQVELSLTMGLLGLAYTHSDLGGFAGGDVFDAELYTRWLQYGVFQPVYRPHAQENIAPEPVFHDELTRNIIRDFIRLRYALLPYNYSLSYLNSQTGQPMMRPLFYTQPDNLALLGNTASYMWGEAFLVTPVTEPGVDSVQVELPTGVWFDYFTGQRYEGGQRIEQPTRLETLPVLVKAGSFVPMVEPVQTTSDYSSEKLILHYYADAAIRQGQGMMYEDDGQTFGAPAKQQYELLYFTASQEETKLSIQLKREAFAYKGMPQNRQMHLQVHNWRASPSKVEVNGAVLPVAANAGKFGALKQGIWLDRETQILHLKFSWRDDNTRLLLH
ncbi:glycoside hydrolase family 31 protein [Bowmanella dokdonensis]|uniref:DUF5110 domain-containing protein n=1 Tax=Bowmanella dokdonensis TaxID=751969 RepID=A0A939DQ49_9ALTE|nr:TIM-barrel domain-containing protein [Bowmanella dokdonensis]MBN7826613.1 DUF5110 domain-containing protein [Bowmanella dokdonensis]